MWEPPRLSSGILRLQCPNIGLISLKASHPGGVYFWVIAHVASSITPPALKVSCTCGRSQRDPSFTITEEKRTRNPHIYADSCFLKKELIR